MRDLHAGHADGRRGVPGFGRCAEAKKRSARPSPATCAAAPATPRSSTPSPSPPTGAPAAEPDAARAAGRVAAHPGRGLPGAGCHPAPAGRRRHRPDGADHRRDRRATGARPGPVGARRAARHPGRRRRPGDRCADDLHRDPPLARASPSSCRPWPRRRRRSAPPRSRTAARSAATSPTPRPPATRCRSCWLPTRSWCWAARAGSARCRPPSSGRRTGRPRCAPTS